MAVNIDKPWVPTPVQYQQAPVAQPRGPSELEKVVTNKVGGAVADAGISAGTNALLGKAAVEGGAAATQGLLGAGGALGGGSLGASLGSALGGAGTALGTAGLGAAATAAAPFVLGGAALGKAFGLFNQGTTNVQMDYGPDPLALEDGSTKISKIYKEGYTAPGQAYAIAKNMGYQEGTDSVPAMLTPGEAVIPAPAAQDPANKDAIAGMVEQGRAMNDGMDAPSPMQNGPLSGKTKREELKLMQDMSLKKKSWMADEKRKQEAHEQKMELDRQRASQAMRQSQE